MEAAQSSVLRTSPPNLSSVQALVADQLEGVQGDLQGIIISDLDLIEEINEYLLLMRGKLFRPTLLLLSSEVGGNPPDDAITLAAVVELVHLATLVHDDADDHSV